MVSKRYQVTYQAPVWQKSQNWKIAKSGSWQVHWSYRCICPPNSSPCSAGVIVSSQAGHPSPPPHILTYHSIHYLHIFACMVRTWDRQEFSWVDAKRAGAAPPNLGDRIIRPWYQTKMEPLYHTKNTYRKYNKTHILFYKYHVR